MLRLFRDLIQNHENALQIPLGERTQFQFGDGILAALQSSANFKIHEVFEIAVKKL